MRAKNPNNLPKRMSLSCCFLKLLLRVKVFSIRSYTEEVETLFKFSKRYLEEELQETKGGIRQCESKSLSGAVTIGHQTLDQTIDRIDEIP